MFPFLVVAVRTFFVLADGFRIGNQESFGAEA